ncbi:hypothetical protein HK105_204793 [Polyrhizophydium stewartii]|uniref:Sulfurtransferase n=1 Tax=Polyrhizophydium stewartii TaxID=2732419 RepID=A0ABR4N7V2_9FUNG|nr:hypothetical protein HK105_002867 [Polyrhizophydium stewartii]
MLSKAPALIAPSALAALRTAVVLDGSWHMPATRRNAAAEFAARHIPGARFFDIDAVADRTTTLPHMLPTPRVFAESVGRLGISDKDHVVIYDTAGVGPACRVYWTFRAFGHTQVSVLDGGLPRWTAEGRPTETGEAVIEARTYAEPGTPTLVRTYEDIVRAMTTRDAQIVDARPAGRFTGAEPEPRAGLRSGHMPTAVSVPSGRVVDPATGTMLPAADLAALFTSAGLDLARPIICTCGSGVTASVLFVALERAGARDVSVYDGSWTEYAGRPGSVIEP